MLRSVGVGALASGLVLALAPAAAADTRTSGRLTIKDGASSVKVSWSYGCGRFTFVSHDPVDRWTFHPWWDAAAKERGQTRWRKIRFIYKFRDTGDTSDYKTVIGSIARRDAVFDPPRFSSTAEWEDVDDIWGVGIKVAVSTDGVTWKRVYSSSMLTCAPPK